jgi:hypothetical protein
MLETRAEGLDDAGVELRARAEAELGERVRDR